MDSLLRQFDISAVRVVGYADDVLFMIQGPDPPSMIDLMQEAIDRAYDWAGQNGLKFNPAKTECCFFHRKQARNTPVFADLYMGGVKLKYSHKIKYLGLTLDKKNSLSGNTSWKNA